jgi:hypothetical protein
MNSSDKKKHASGHQQRTNPHQRRLYFLAIRHVESLFGRALTDK